MSYESSQLGMQKGMKRAMSYTDWEEMLFASDVAFLEAIEARLQEGDYLDAMTGVEVLRANMAALVSRLAVVIP